MISAEHLTIEFAAKPLFTDASFQIGKRDRIALVGKNGAGKSTMLKMLAGLQQPTAGVIAVQRDVSVGYLPQVMKLAEGHTVIEEVAKAFSHVSALEKEIKRLERELAERTDYESEDYADLVERFSRKSEHYQIIGGQGCQAEMERTLLGLGFVREDFQRPTCEFSGGWRMRMELAKLLLSQPDVLLLDEPTNHLDIESIQWLENFLSQRASAVVLVSHDRAFINNVTNRTMEISCGRVTDYKVKYDDYVRLRQERREQQLKAWQNQQKEIADIKDFVERFRYKPTKSNQVQSRLKQLEKIVPIEIDEVDKSALRLKFPPCQRSGDFPLICEGVKKSYGAHTIFEDVNLTLRRGDKVAFVGKNGEGKSTLVKCIMGEIPFEGYLKRGHNIQLGYYAQNQAQLLPEELTALETVDQVARGEVRLKIRDIMGSFMFGGEEGDKKVKVLSGGERSRLAMIKLLLEPVNFLILDEPTNHLDMRSKDVLKDAIRAFDGTVIVVSHDREFLDGLVTKVYEFGGGKVREHIGGIYDFLQKRQINSLDMLQSVRKEPENTAATDEDRDEKDNGRLSYEEQKKLSRKLDKLKKDVAERERQIADTEAAIALLEQQMTMPENASDTSLFQRHGRLKEQLDKALTLWEEESLALEEASNKMP